MSLSLHPTLRPCFCLRSFSLASGSYHLSLLVVSNSVDAAVTLRGLLTNFTASTDPGTNVTTVTPLVRGA